jgi:hypothetical protein
MTEEDEEFNRIEREAAMRKEEVKAHMIPAKQINGKFWITAGDHHQALAAPVANHYVDGGHLIYPAAQRTWVGLTDDEMQDCLNGLPTQTIDVYARRIEAKLKEKNT